MAQESREVSPHADGKRVVAEDGTVLEIPRGWELLPPGDADLTRKLKSLGPSWTVKVWRKRRRQSAGVWAPAENLAEARRLVAERRDDPSYSKRREADARRRSRTQAAYVEEFEAAVIEYLAFGSRHGELAARVARAVAEHATPVGSGTVARTKRITVVQRAAAATLAWLRHNASDYDNRRIPRERGARREVRREIAERSRRILRLYRRDVEVRSEHCILRSALAKWDRNRRRQP